MLLHMAGLKLPRVYYFQVLLKLTNNTELINLANKLGHGISYTITLTNEYRKCISDMGKLNQWITTSTWR